MTKRELLEKIKRGELSPAEGMAQLQALARRKDRETPQAASAEGAIAGQAVRLHRPGTLAELALEAIEVGPPGPGQIRVRTRAFSLNFGDLLSLRGLYPTMPPYPFTPGFELAGIVDALGPGVAGPGALEVGDAVIAMLGEAMGAHASVVLVDAGSVVPKPASVSFAEACAAPVAFLTATHVLARAGLEAGESILIQSAAGGVGLFLVQLARAAGATIFGTASTPAKLEHLRSLGVQHPINYVEHDFHERVQALTAGRGVDVVVNTLTGEAIQKGLDLLAPGGRYVEIAMSGLKAAPKLDLSGLCDNQSFISVDLRRLMLRDRALTARYVARMVEALEARTALPTIGRVFPLESIREAYALLEDRGNVGKVVVEVPEAPARVQPERVQVTTTPKAAAPRSDAGALEPIAVVGMAGRFPSSENLDAFWSNLAEGRDCVAEIPAQRWSVVRWFDADPTRGDTTYCRWGGVLDEVDRFDPAFFHMSRREAELCEPQQRVFLETAWHALDHAGYAAPVGTGRGTGRAGSCGVYVGASTGDYVDVLEAAGSHRAPQAMIGNESSVIAGRIAYTLDLDGPAVVVNTACSASLVAIHMACEALRAGACEMALAGGVFVSLTPAFFVLASNARMLSPTGRCRSFARDADGFVPGEGVGAVVLKPLSAARRDGDRVYGLIRASAMNQDGRTNALTAPSPRAQAKLMRSVYARAGVSPRTIDAIEAHGTGTKLGDPVEVDALTEVFREATEDSSFCALGSVKSSIGHAVTAAGVASVLKMLLGLQRGAIPPTLHAEADNEFIDFPSTPFFVNRELTPWVRGESPRRAGVSSFGFSGTNAHLLLEEAPADLVDARGSASRGPWLFPISGFDAAARGRVAERLGAWLRDGSEADSLGDLAFTLQRRRAHLGVRAAVVASTREELLEALDALAEGRLHAALICGPERGEGELGAPAGLLELAERELEARLSAVGGELDLASARAVGELYVSGREPAWQHLPTGRVLSLPPYPFARVRCWPSAAARGRAVELEPAPDYGLLAGGPAFRVRVSGDDPMLAEHRVAGRAILPGVASVELALAALDRVAPGQARGGAGVRLEQLMWLRPLVAEGPGGLEAYVTTRAIEGGVELRVETQAETGERQLHTQVFARWGVPGVGVGVAASTPVASLDSSVEVEDFYGRLGRAHIDYGPWYRCVRGIAATPEGLVAELALAPERRAELERYRLHPGLADAAMQAVAGLILGVGAQSQGAGASRPAVAVSVDRVLVLRPPKARCFAHVHAHAGEELCFTVTVADERGQTCARFEGLRLATLESDAPCLVHAPSWEPVLESQALVEGDTVVLLAGGLAPGLPAGVSVRAVANPTRAGFAAALSGSKPARVVACFGADAQPWSLVALAAALESLELDALELSVVTCGAE
ncbi:mixed type I polyketide synthase - peptide synthetase, partial [Plesiocystis pacifica SIR-1]